MPAVSVIVPVYNVAPYLAEALESILAQTFTDYEIVIVNDGSTDGSLPIAERYRARHPQQITLISHENRGLAGARNTALRAAQGEFLALLDSDDGWFPTFLEDQLRILTARPDVAIVTGNAFERGGPRDGEPARPYPDSRPAPDLLEILRDERAVFIMTVFRRQVVDRIGGFDERFRTNEDYDFWIRAAHAGFRFARNDKPLGFYRVHASSLSASDLRMNAGILRVCRKALELCGPDTAAGQILQQQMARFELTRLAAEAREALDRGDAAAAADAIEALRAHEGGSDRVLLALVSRVLRITPRAALWAYRTRQRTRLVTA